MKKFTYINNNVANANFLIYERTTNTIFKPRKFITKLQHSNYSKYGINALAQSENEITPNQILMFCFRPESYVKLHRIEQCIPEMSSLKEEDAKWKINIKHEPACALHTKPDVKMKKEPGSRNEKPLKHDPGYTPTHDLSVVTSVLCMTQDTLLHMTSVLRSMTQYTLLHMTSVMTEMETLTFQRRSSKLNLMSVMAKLVSNVKVRKKLLKTVRKFML